MMPLGKALYVMKYGALLKRDRDAAHAVLFVEAERVLDTLLAASNSPSNLSGFAHVMIVEWLRRASVLTVRTFLDAHAADALPNLSEFSGLMTNFSGLRSPDMLLRETLMFHNKVEYYPDDLPEVLSAIAAVHLSRTGREMDPLDYPDEPEHAEHMALFRLAYALRYTQSDLVETVRDNRLFTVYRSAVPRDQDIIRFAIENPERIDEIKGVLDERPGADGSVIVSILNAPARALSSGML